MRVAVIDKQPSSVAYAQFFELEDLCDVEVLHLSSVKIGKVLKKDVDLEGFNPEEYDYVILVGAEAAKHIAGISSVTALAGSLVKDKFIPMINPAILTFKPAMVDEFDRAVNKCKRVISGESDLKTADIRFTECGDEALEMLLEAEKHPVVALDTETSALYPRDGYLLGVSVTWTDNQGVYISADVLDVEHVAILQRIINTRIVVMHNAKFDIKWMNYHLELDFSTCDIQDTMLLHYLLDETQGTHGLKGLALKYTEYGNYDDELDIFKKTYCKAHRIKQAEFSYAFIPFEVIGQYAAMDTAVTFALFLKFFPIVKRSPQLYPVYTGIMIPGMLFLNDMEENGVPFNRGRLAIGQAQMDREIDELKRGIYEYKEVKALELDTGVPFNPGSVLQLRKLLFTHCGLRPTGRLTGKKEHTTDALALQELGSQHELPGLILELRQRVKIKSTYLDKILLGLDRDVRLRTGFNLTATTSGRLSSSGKLNMQQLPRDNKLVKGCIQAPEGYTIVSQDLQTGEMYYAAVLSGDKKLQNVFISGGDFHSTIAHQAFNLPCEISEVKSLYGNFRQAAKAISFGILYGSGPDKVAETVNKFNAENGINEVFTTDDAKDAIAQYFKTYKKLKSWLKEQSDIIKAQGCIYSALGRKRRLKDVFSKDKGTAAGQVRSGINFLVQSVSSDINLLAAIDVNFYLKENNRTDDAKIFALVHDSILAIVKDEYVDEFIEVMARFTQMDRGVSIIGAPIGVDAEQGQDYSFGGFEKQYPELALVA